jgi:AraC-like DNA-binding protein
MTHKERLENLAFNIGRPFSAQEASEMCSIGKTYTKKLLKEMTDEGTLEVQRVVNLRFFWQWKGKPKEKRIRNEYKSPETELSDKVEHKIKTEGYTSLRAIAQQVGCSHEYVRQVMKDRGLENNNQEITAQRLAKTIKKELLHVLKIGKKVIKQERQRPFLDSIIPYDERI